MKTVGEMLKKEREKQHKSLTEISEQTFISLPHLQALEQNQFHLLPSIASVRGFLLTYAGILEIPKETVLALLRRDFEAKQDTVIPVSSVSTFHKPLKHHRPMVIMALLMTSVVTIGGYGIWTFQRLHQPPKLVITSPQDAASVRTPVTIRGRTDSDAVVEIDTQPVAVTQDGEFATEEELPSGEHTITVVARNRQGIEHIQQVGVTVAQ